MTRAIAIALSALLAGAAGLLLWLPASPALEEQAFRSLYDGSPAAREDAIRLYQQALAADPLSPYRWCDLSEAWLELSRPDQARSCMRRAQELGPYIPQVWVRAANLYFRLADEPEALRAGAAVLGMTPAYDGVLFRYCGQFVSDPRRVLAHLTGNSRAAAAYFRYAIATGSLATAEIAWAWLRQHTFASDPLAVEYQDFLIAQRQSHRAAEVWAEYLGRRRGDFPVSNRLFNGGFEAAPTGALLDWRIQPVGQVETSRDSNVVFEGRWSLRVEFAGDQNVAYAHTSQTAVLPPGNYRLRAMARSKGLTTDQGLVLRVAGDRLDARTPQLSGSTDWIPLETAFAVSAATNLVAIQVFREPSLKFDNKIAGTAWIDAVSLQSH